MKKLRVLTSRAHCGHQYELWKLPIDVYVISGLGDHIESWSYNQRPFPKNAQYIRFDQVVENQFDLAILHFDEYVLCPRHPKLNDKWGKTFRWMMDNLKDIPKVAICHGTPQFKEQGLIENETLKVSIYEDRQKQMVDYLGDTLVICNSNQAREEWKFKRSKTIWHGFDPNEFVKGSNTGSILSPSDISLKDRPHYRGYYIYRDILKYLPLKYRPTPTLNPELADKSDLDIYSKKMFNNYITLIGKYSIYLNTTLLSPMPRARGEAMMCGVIPVCTNNHDVDLFIKNGIDGFFSNDQEELCSFIAWLMNNTDKRKKINENSRISAIKFFNINRYLNDWNNLIKGII